MKKALANFSEGMLSKDQMKAVRGGAIYCTCSTYAGLQAGRCSGSSVAQCESYRCGSGGSPSCWQN